MLVHLMSLLLAGDALTPERAATIESEQAKEMKAVEAKYGDRKPSQLSNDERRAMARDQADAERRVLEKHGVTAKEWARDSARRSRGASAAVQRARGDLDQKEKAAAEAAKQGAQPKEIQVQRGFNDSNPVTLEGNAGGAGDVSVGAEADAAAAREADEALKAGTGDDAERPRPAKAKSSRRR